MSRRIALAMRRLNEISSAVAFHHRIEDAAVGGAAGPLSFRGIGRHQAPPPREYLRGESAGELRSEWLKLASSDARAGRA
jgi:hypothetical protein